MFSEEAFVVPDLITLTAVPEHRDRNALSRLLADSPHVEPFDDSARKDVLLSNPRQVGKHYFLRLHPGSIESSAKRKSADDIEVHEYFAALTILVRMKSGAIKRPVFPVMGGYFGELGGVVQQRRLSSGRASASSVPNESETDFPVGPDIATYVLVLEPRTEKLPACIYEIDAEELKKAQRIVIPDAITLPPVAGHADRALLEALIAER